jgi:ribonuclease P protein component
MANSYSSSFSSIKKQHDFSLVFKRNSSYSQAPFKVLIGREVRLDSRLGIIVSKKNHRLAVDRNYIKRISREAFRASALTINRDIILIVGAFDVIEMRTKLFSTIYNVFEKINKEPAPR